MQFERRDGLIVIPYHKGCVLALTEGEFLAGLRRGKMIRRAQATERRSRNPRKGPGIEPFTGEGSGLSRPLSAPGEEAEDG